MASFLGREQEKIGQGIAQSDFAGELQRFLSPVGKQSASSRFVADDSPKTGAKESAGFLESAAEATPASRTAPTSQTTPVPRTSPAATTSTAGRKKSAATETKAQVRNQKVRAKNGEELLLTNPAMTETILSNLQCSAETIKACKNIQNKDGMISLKDLKNLLNSQAETEAVQSTGQVSAEQVGALLGSITTKGSGQPTNTTQAKSSKIAASATIKRDGSYTLPEFSELVDQVLNRGIETPEATAAQPLRANAASTKITLETASQTMASSKPDLTESLTASILPPFLSEGWNEQTGTRAKTSHDGSSQPENIPAQASIDGAGQENVRKVETAARKTNEQAQAVNAPPKGSITQADDNGLSSGSARGRLGKQLRFFGVLPRSTVAAGKDVRRRVGRLKT